MILPLYCLKNVKLASYTVCSVVQGIGFPKRNIVPPTRGRPGYEWVTHTLYYRQPGSAGYLIGRYSNFTSRGTPYVWMVRSEIGPIQCVKQNGGVKFTGVLS